MVWFWLIYAAAILIAGGCCFHFGGGWCLAAALSAALAATLLAALAGKSGKRGKVAGWSACIFAFSALAGFPFMAAKGVSPTVFAWIFWICLAGSVFFGALLRSKAGKEEIVSSLCSGVLLPDTCFLMDLAESPSHLSLFQVLEKQFQERSFKMTLHRHVYQEIRRLANSDNREKSRKARSAKKLIERWQKLGIIETYPNLEDAEKSYYADDALLKYMGKLLQNGEKVLLLTNDYDLRIRARDRFEKQGRSLPEDALLSFNEFFDKAARLGR